MEVQSMFAQLKMGSKLNYIIFFLQMTKKWFFWWIGHLWHSLYGQQRHS